MLTGKANMILKHRQKTKEDIMSADSVNALTFRLTTRRECINTLINPLASLRINTRINPRINTQRIS